MSGNAVQATVSPTRGVVTSLAAACARRPRVVLSLWGVGFIVLFIAGQNGAASLKATDVVVAGADSTKALALERTHFGESESLAVLLEGPRRQLDRYGRRAARQIDKMPRVGVLSPWSASAPRTLRPRPNQAVLALQVSRSFSDTGTTTTPTVKSILDRTLPSSVRSFITGNAAIAAELNRVGFAAAKRSEGIAIPVLIVILLLVFRTPVAAAIPALLGLTAVTCGGGIVALISRMMPVDAMATTAVSMLGLALGVDYSLLIVSRFRDEIASGCEPTEALGRTAATAGRTIAFAGIVVISAMLVALVLAPGGMMKSAALGVVGAASLAMAGSATLVPALLTTLGPHLDRWPIWRQRRESRIGSIVGRLIRRPVLASALVLVPLLALSGPAFGLEVGSPTESTLPNDNPYRQDIAKIDAATGGGWAAPFTVIAVSDAGPMTDRQRLPKLARFQRRVASLDWVGTVFGPAALDRSARRLDRATRAVASQSGQLGRLRRGLAQTGTGVGRLRGGMRRAETGAHDLGLGLDAWLGGARQANDGAARLERAAAEATNGSRRLGAAVSQARTGSDRIAAAAAEIEASSAQMKDATTQAAGEASAGREGLDELRSATTTGTSALSAAVAALDRATAATKVDPAYRDAYAQAATALGALTGKHPQTGQPVASGYAGLSASLARAAEQSTVAAKEAQRLASGVTKLHGAIAQVNEGSSDLSSGLGRIDSRTSFLTAGLKRTRSGMRRQSSGAARLTGGAARLTGGARDLATQLGEGGTSSAGLQYGVGRMERSVARGSTRSEALAGRPPTTSGYFLLAGIDAAGRRAQDRAALAVNWDRGGSSTRLIVMPGSDPGSTPTTAEPGDADRLNELAADAAQLRQLAPTLARDTGSQTAVGGRGAALVDFIHAASESIPTLLLTLILVSLVLLTFVFRSPVLALKAVALNMLTLGAALGVLVLVAQGDEPLLGGPGQLDAITLVAIVAVVFALSIDYEVFLIMRMREGYARTGSTEGAIAYGLDHTARVITGAAAIMIGVFFAFGLADFITVRALGIGLGVAVLLDATVVRLILLPATMRLLGRANWWMPRWLDRLLPELAVEGEST